MELLADMLIWVPGLLTALVLTWVGHGYFRRRQTRLTTSRMSRALTVSHGVFNALQHMPDALITRDLRRGLVLLLTHQLAVLRETNSMHPHLQELQARVTKLNRIPSSLQTAPLRSKIARRHTSIAIDELVKLLKDATKHHILDQKTGALAHACAVFAGHQVAVEIARCAARDAENIRAYAKALSFAHQALALCSRLPPLLGKTLTNAVSQDIERLNSLVGYPAKI